MPPQKLKRQDWNPQLANPANKKAFEVLANTNVSDSRQLIGKSRLPPGRPPLHLPGEVDARIHASCMLRDLNDRLSTLEALLSAGPYTSAATFRIKSTFVITAHLPLLCDIFRWVCHDLTELELDNDATVERCTDCASFELLVGQILETQSKVKIKTQSTEYLKTIWGKAQGLSDCFEMMKKHRERASKEKGESADEHTKPETPKEGLGGLQTIAEVDDDAEIDDDDEETGDNNDEIDSLGVQAGSNCPSSEEDNIEDDDKDDEDDEDDEDEEDEEDDEEVEIKSLNDGNTTGSKARHKRRRKRLRQKRRGKLIASKLPTCK